MQVEMLHKPINGTKTALQLSKSHSSVKKRKKPDTQLYQLNKDEDRLHSFVKSHCLKQSRESYCDCIAGTKQNKIIFTTKNKSQYRKYCRKVCSPSHKKDI